MIHPFTKLQFISEQKGFGVVATSFIPKGTITWVQDKLDRVFSKSELKKLGQEYVSIIETYSFRNQEGNYILCWDHGRFINHSFKANCITTPYNFEIAIRDIQVGEELTDDYGYLNVSEPFEGVDEGTERKVVYPDDLLNYAHDWNKILDDSFPEITNVDQPLYNFLNAEDRRNMVDVLLGNKELDSILTCYYHEKET